MMTALMMIRLAASLALAAAASPPRWDSLTPEQQRSFTLDGASAVEHFFVDDSGRGNGTHYKYPARYIDQLVEAARAEAASCARRAAPPASAPPPPRCWLHAALRRRPIDGLDVAVFGTVEPTVEAACLAHGASSVTTVEYNELTLEHARLRAVRPAALFGDGGGGGAAAAAAETFDAALAISSFDHDGLGRYGDPLAPDGDLRAMATTARAVRPGGHLYLTVPVGPDVVAWNLLRRYGRARLPLLLQQRAPPGGDACEADERGGAWDGAQWEELPDERVGWSDELLDDAARDWRRSVEPVFVLRRR